MREIPKFTIHPPKKKDVPGYVRITTSLGFTITRDIKFEYAYRNPTPEQKDQLTNYVIKCVQIHSNQHEEAFESVGREDTDIDRERVWINGKVVREDFPDNHPTSVELKQKLASKFKYYEHKMFFPYSPTVFDIFSYNKLNRYAIGMTEDNFVHLNCMKVTDQLFFGCLPMFFNSFNHKNFYTQHECRFTLIHDMISKAVRIKWHFPMSPVIADYKKIPVIPESMVFESQRTFDTQGILVSMGARIFADHELINQVCEKHKLPHPLPEDKKVRPWAYDITFDDHGRILEIAALEKVYQYKEQSFTFKSSY